MRGDFWLILTILDTIVNFECVNFLIGNWILIDESFYLLMILYMMVFGDIWIGPSLRGRLKFSEIDLMIFGKSK